MHDRISRTEAKRGCLQDDGVQKAILAKLNRNLMALFFCLTVLCYLDRTNLAFASLQLNKDLDFSKRVYGLGSGPFFFLGYVTFQVTASPFRKQSIHGVARRSECCRQAAMGRRQVART